MSTKMKNSNGMLSRIAKMLDFPADAFGSIPVVELKGNAEATVYGCRKVVDYSCECVKFKTVKNVVIICGSDLLLSDFTAGTVSVCGNICCVRLDKND